MAGVHAARVRLTAIPPDMRPARPFRVAAGAAAQDLALMVLRVADLEGRLARLEAENAGLRDLVAGQSDMMARVRMDHLALEGRLAMVDALREALDRQVDPSLPVHLAHVLAEVSVPAAASFARIVDCVSVVTGVPLAEMVGPGRSLKRSAAHARQEVMRLARDQGCSLRDIASALSCDHTTVVHGIKAARARLAGREGA